jgi:four helix bundle protein
MCRAIDARGTDLVLVKQVMRSGTSIGANVEEAQGGHTRRDFVAKMSIAYKEARETKYWLKIMRDIEMVPAKKLEQLIDEGGQILKILASILLTTKSNSPKSPEE